MPSVVGRRGSNFTVEEHSIILEHVRNHPQNLREAFRRAAKELEENGRTRVSNESVRITYYNRLRKQYPVFTLEGRDQSFSNTKIVSNRTKTIYTVENPTVEALANQYNKLASKQKQDFQVLIK